jgi:hypothetical protein
MQDNGNISIDMNMINGVQTISSYSQLSWFMHLLQNLLAGSIVVLRLPPICVPEILIYMMFTARCICLPVGNQRYEQKHIPAES